jgi:hypothetical protein
MKVIRPRSTPKIVRVFLGVFIVWQLVFLFSSNILSLLNKAHSLSADESGRKGPIPDFEQGMSKVMARWSELTGQPQSWSLFAPNVTSTIPFVAVEFCWEDDPTSVSSISRLLAPIAAFKGVDAVSLVAIAWRNDPRDRNDIEDQIKILSTQRIESALPSNPIPPQGPWCSNNKSWVVFSDNEPVDIQKYIKFGHFRLRRYESSIDIAPASADKERDAVVDGWREEIESRVRDRWRLMQAYMKWQMQHLLKKNPGLPEPRQVILWARIYRVPAAEGSSTPEIWLGPEWHPVARWQPNGKWEDKHLPVEMFNPVVGRFESIRLREDEHHE